MDNPVNQLYRPDAASVRAVLPSPAERAIVLLLFTVVALCLASAAWGAEDEVEDPEKRWIFGLSLTSGLTIQTQNGSFESAVSPDPRDLGLDDPDAGDDLVVSPNVGIRAELMSPGFEDLPLQPRAFVQIGALPTFAVSRDLAKVGAPSALELPFDFELPLEQIPLPIPFPETAIRGAGSRTQATVDTGVYMANVGVAMSSHFRGRRLRFKPSIGWINFTTDVRGQVLRGFKLRQFGGVRFVELENDASLNMNGIGPGFELEMELMRRGSIQPALYVDGQVYRIVGDRTVAFSDALTVEGGSLQPELGTATYRADWDFEAEPWMYRLGIGFRFKWVGRLDWPGF